MTDVLEREPQYRLFRPDLEVRSSGDGRTICGIAVPYDAPTKIHDSLIESFARGAFNHQLRDPSRVKLAREHVLLGGAIIGAATVLRDDAIGLYCEMRCSRTPLGDETLELVRDGALSQLSIYFQVRQNRRLTGGITQRVTAHLKEIAVVTEGAYDDKAAIVALRSQQLPPFAEEIDLNNQVDEYLRLPDLPDHDVEIRRIRLGL